MMELMDWLISGFATCGENCFCHINEDSNLINDHINK